MAVEALTALAARLWPVHQHRAGFSSPGIHVVLGKNEAGKSTALRAITGLLYGIPKNTADAHTHKMPDLRVGGALLAKTGAALEFVRRKGKDNTLLDPKGQPLDEAVLASVLGGISQEQFITMFGLDHESLRRGGDALLLGQGNVGESLFGAAMAGAEVHHVLQSLVTEAEGLFTAKAHTKPLNEAIKAWSAAHKRTREAETSHESIDAQTRGLDELRRDRAECEIALKRLNVERAKLERIARALPLLTKRRALAQRRRDLGIIAPLPASAGQARLDDLRTVSEALLEIQRLEKQQRRAHAPQPRDRGPRVTGTSSRGPARPDRPSRHLQKGDRRATAPSG